LKCKNLKCKYIITVADPKFRESDGLVGPRIFPEY
jgi:hypothetical protein